MKLRPSLPVCFIFNAHIIFKAYLPFCFLLKRFQDKRKTPQNFFWSVFCSSRRLPIFTRRLQRTIFGTSELNFCVRNGNRWNPVSYTHLDVYKRQAVSLHVLSERIFSPFPALRIPAFSLFCNPLASVSYTHLIIPEFRAEIKNYSYLFWEYFLFIFSTMLLECAHGDAESAPCRLIHRCV